MGIFFKIILMTFIFFSTIFSKDGDGREIIKAYEKGKPAKMDIEITKVKSDNYINMIIDRSNKKIYKDITEFAPENRDLQKKLYITDYIKRLDKSNIRETLPYRVMLYDNKKYLEIDYSNIEEPKEIYFWVVEGRKVKKLYTGVMKKEYFDPNNPLSYLALGSLKIYGDDEKGIDISDIKDNKIKIAEISMANLNERKLQEKAILLQINDEYILESSQGEKIEVKLKFREDNIYRVQKNNEKIEIFAEILEIKKLKEKEYFIKNKEDNLKRIGIKVNFITRGKGESLYINNYKLAIKNPKPEEILTKTLYDSSLKYEITIEEKKILKINGIDIGPLHGNGSQEYTLVDIPEESYKVSGNLKDTLVIELTDENIEKFTIKILKGSKLLAMITIQRKIGIIIDPIKKELNLLIFKEGKDGAQDFIEIKTTTEPKVWTINGNPTINKRIDLTKGDNVLPIDISIEGKGTEYKLIGVILQNDIKELPVGLYNGNVEIGAKAVITEGGKF